MTVSEYLLMFGVVLSGAAAVIAAMKLRRVSSVSLPPGGATDCQPACEELWEASLTEARADDAVDRADRRIVETFLALVGIAIAFGVVVVIVGLGGGLPGIPGAIIAVLELLGLGFVIAMFFAALADADQAYENRNAARDARLDAERNVRDNCPEDEAQRCIDAARDMRDNFLG